MHNTLILVNSITHASHGKKVLAKQGIPSNIVRNLSREPAVGCGYALSVRADALVVQGILMQAGIKVIGIMEEV